MFKLTNILQEIEIKRFEKPYTSTYVLNKLKKPTNDDTMASWLDKNNIEYDFNKYKLIQYKANCSVNIWRAFDVDYDKLAKLMKKNDSVIDKEKYDKFISKPVSGEWQNYFNQYCGPNRVKVWNEPLTVIIRVVLPNVVSPEEFKMLP